MRPSFIIILSVGESNYVVGQELYPKNICGPDDFCDLIASKALPLRINITPSCYQSNQLIFDLNKRHPIRSSSNTGLVALSSALPNGVTEARKFQADSELGLGPAPARKNSQPDKWSGEILRWNRGRPF